MKAPKMLGAPYTRPNKPFSVERGQAPEIGAKPSLDAPKPLYVDKFTECHVTPAAIAAQMAHYLGEPPQPPQCTLEPQAGTGALLKALEAQGYDPAYIFAIERYNTLAAALDTSLAAHIVNGCFLDFASQSQNQGRFNRILMNPPFRNVKAHFRAALACLAAHEAVLVALVPVTFHHGPEEILAQLPDTTFQTAKVRTKIIRIVRH